MKRQRAIGPNATSCLVSVAVSRLWLGNFDSRNVLRWLLATKRVRRRAMRAIERQAKKAGLH